jgi:enoyl-[acyl-carrier protein] reductase II
VQLGTRFVAACETWAHQNYKRAIVAAGDTDTTVTCRRLLPTRSLKTGFSERLLELENSGASAEELSAFMGYSRARTAQVEGDLENGEAYCGASAGLIREVLPAATIIRQLVDGCSDVFSRLL